MNNYQKEFNEEFKDTTWTFWRIFSWGVGVILTMSLLGYAFGWFGEAASVAQDEFGAKASLAKYEWFIDQETKIASMDVTIKNFHQKQDAIVNQFTKDYGGQTSWYLLTKNNYQKQIDLVREQLQATIAQRNTLAADYNAQSEKFNWSHFKGKDKIPRQKFYELNE